MCLYFFQNLVKRLLEERHLAAARRDGASREVLGLGVAAEMAQGVGIVVHDDGLRRGATPAGEGGLEERRGRRILAFLRQCRTHDRVGRDKRPPLGLGEDLASRPFGDSKVAAAVRTDHLVVQGDQRAGVAQPVGRPVVVPRHRVDREDRRGAQQPEGNEITFA